MRTAATAPDADAPAAGAGAARTGKDCQPVGAEGASTRGRSGTDGWSKDEAAANRQEIATRIGAGIPVVDVCGQRAYAAE